MWCISVKAVEENSHLDVLNWSGYWAKILAVLSVWSEEFDAIQCNQGKHGECVSDMENWGIIPLSSMDFFLDTCLIIFFKIIQKQSFNC